MRYKKVENIYTYKQKFYHKKIWKDLRKYHIMQEPLCQLCFQQKKLTPAYAVDHIIPFENEHDPLATDSTNLKSLCLECHSVVTARETKRPYETFPTYEAYLKYKYKPRIEIGLDGYPL